MTNQFESFLNKHLKGDISNRDGYIIGGLAIYSFLVSLFIYTINQTLSNIGFIILMSLVFYLLITSIKSETELDAELNGTGV